jgi:hypothetical protein
MNDLEAINRASRLEQMGIVVRSPQLLEKAQSIAAFNAAGGNRAMRRAAKRAARRR